MAHVTGALLKVGDIIQGKRLLKRLNEWRKTVANYWGVFWPLTLWSLENDDWIAWQFDRPEVGEGVVQVFRLAECERESLVV
jgi:alpha-galactosidase